MKDKEGGRNDGISFVARRYRAYLHDHRIALFCDPVPSGRVGDLSRVWQSLHDQLETLFEMLHEHLEEMLRLSV